MNTCCKCSSKAELCQGNRNYCMSCCVFKKGQYITILDPGNAYNIINYLKDNSLVTQDGRLLIIR